MRNCVFALIILGIIGCVSSGQVIYPINNDTCYDNSAYFKLLERPEPMRLHDGSFIFPDTKYKNYLRISAIFNPNNANEILVSGIKDNGDILPLTLINLCNGNSSIIANEVAIDLDWNVNNWIVFKTMRQSIFVVKANGDSLLKVVEASGYNNTPIWLGNNNNFMYQKVMPVGGSRVWVLNTKGIKIDSIDALKNRYPCFDFLNEKILYTQPFPQKGVYQYDIQSKTTSFLFSVDIPNNNIPLAKWKNENSVIWGNTDYVFLSNFTNRTTDTLISCGENIRYNSIGVSNNGKYLISTRWDIFLANKSKGTEIHEASIVIIDIEKKLEWKILAL